MRSDDDLIEQIKQAAQRQARLAALQAKLPGLSETGTAGGGKVIVTIDGRGELFAVKIDAALLEAKNAGEIEALIVGAARLARRRIDQTIDLEMAKL